jgi:hypothetical protein
MPKPHNDAEVQFIRDLAAHVLAGPPLRITGENYGNGHGDIIVVDTGLGPVLFLTNHDRTFAGGPARLPHYVISGRTDGSSKTEQIGTEPDFATAAARVVAAVAGLRAEKHAATEKNTAAAYEITLRQGNRDDAYDAGREAKHNNRPHVNPYPAGHTLNAVWEDGWNHENEQ